MAKKPQHPNNTRTAKIANAVARLNNAVVSADELRLEFHKSLAAVPLKEVAKLETVLQKELALLTMNEKAFAGLIKARLTILDRLSTQSQLITKLSNQEKA